jgi:hypothetical protein
VAASNRFLLDEKFKELYLGVAHPEEVAPTFVTCSLSSIFSHNHELASPDRDRRTSDAMCQTV